VQHSGDGTKGFVFALVESALAIEVAKQLVGSVDYVDYHFVEILMVGVRVARREDWLLRPGKNRP
jgi:hypothetical protein